MAQTVLQLHVFCCILTCSSNSWSLLKIKKKSHTFNNIENNLYNVLKSNSTLTELAVMALYAQAISHPYICTPGKDLNMLDLGPLHNEVLIHMQKIINTPDLLVGPKVSHTTGALMVSNGIHQSFFLL